MAETGYKLEVLPNQPSESQPLGCSRMDQMTGYVSGENKQPFLLKVNVWNQQGGSAGKGTVDLDLIPGTHMMEGESQPFRVSSACSMCWRRSPEFYSSRKETGCHAGCSLNI